MNTRKTLLTAAIIGLVIVLFVWLAPGNAAGTREYEVVVPAAKSDTQRMIEAYERLSDQYLVLVQNQLVQMASGDRDMLARLERIEKKIDALTAKIDALQKSAPIPMPPVPPTPQVPPMLPMPQDIPQPLDIPAPAAASK
jgi:hypothetical protein